MLQFGEMFLSAGCFVWQHLWGFHPSLPAALPVEPLHFLLPVLETGILCFLKLHYFLLGVLFLPFIQLSGHSRGAAWAQLEVTGASPRHKGWGFSKPPLQIPPAPPGEAHPHPDPVPVLAEKGSSWSAPGATAFLGWTAVAKGGCATAGPKGTAGVAEGEMPRTPWAHKNPHLWEKNLAFFTKAIDFQVGRARELFPASPFCVVGFFPSFGVHRRDMLLQRRSRIS